MSDYRTYKVPGMLVPSVEGEGVTAAEYVKDLNLGKTQEQINKEVNEAIGDDATPGSIKGRIKGLEDQVGEGGTVDERIAETKSEIIGNAATDYNTLGKLEDKIQTEASARQSAISNVIGDAATDYNTLGKLEDKIQAEASARESAVSAEATRAQTAEEQLRQVYEALSQSQPIPVTSLPATGEAGKIYRLAGTNSYADYMYAEGALTTPIKMAEYDNAIDDEPTVRSNNLVKSNGVYKSVFSFSPIGFIENAYLTNGGGINKSSHPDNNTKCAVTDYIPCANGDSIYASTELVANNSICTCIYDANKNCIQSITHSTNGYLSFTIDNENAAYVRATLKCVSIGYVAVNNYRYYLGAYVKDILKDIDKFPTKGNNILISSDAVATEFIRENNNKLYIIGPTSTIKPVDLSEYGLKAGDIISFRTITNNRPNGTSLKFLDSDNNVLSSYTILYELYNRNYKQYCRIPDNAVKLSAVCYVAQIYIEIEVLDYYPVQSSFVTDELKTTLNGLDINVPSMPVISNVVSVSDADELLSAIQSFNEGNTDLSIILTDDIALNPANMVSINNDDRNLAILGNGHSIYVKGGEAFEPEGYSGKYAFSTYNTEPSACLISEDGDYIEQGRTRPFVALSGVLNEDGTTATSTTGIKKILLPYELRGLSISENDHVYINYVAGYNYIRKSERVTKIEDGYLFFNQTSEYNSNALVNTHFRLYNVNDGVGYYTRGGKVYYPAKYTKLYCPVYSANPITITNVSGKVALYDIIFKGFTRFNKSIISSVNTGTIIVQGCSFIGVYCGLYETGNNAGGYIYIDRCYFENVKTRANYSAGNHVIITNNKSYNVGTCEYNEGQHFRVGSLSSYIGHNELINFGYTGIMCSSSICVIEHNLLKYTPEYADYAKIGLVCDSGAIYTGQLDTKCIIRYNKIINYNGIGANHSIYLDDGVYNVYVIGNIVENTISSNSYSIFAYRAFDDADYKNTNRIIAHNIVDNGIRVEGSTRNTPNGCFLGYNIICKRPSHTETYINDLQDQEQQFITNKSYIKDGTLQGNVNMNDWFK